MKKLIVILALVMVVCAPAMAAVNVCYEKSGTTVTVKYSTNGNAIRAFALNMSVSTGTITGVSCTNANYWVYPGSIQITGGAITGSGTCVCASTYPGTNPGVGTSAVTVEMGSLYTGSGTPATSGTLMTFSISNSAATVTLTGNPGRGNVVMENPDESPTVTYGVCSSGECYPNTKADYAQWVTVGKPSCWCFPRQCRGDADGGKQGSSLLGYYYVGSNDLAVMTGCYKVLEPPKGSGIASKTVNGVKGICADFAHDQQGSSLLGYYRVGSNDLSRLTANYKKLEPPKGSGILADCNAP